MLLQSIHPTPTEDSQKDKTYHNSVIELLAPRK
jgi:hypothetical protein